MARSRDWIQRYDLASKNVDTLFGKPLAEWNKLQLDFIRWCKFYHDILSIGDTDDPPSIDTINNDIALDNWVHARRLAIRKNVINSKQGHTSDDGSFVKYKPGGGKTTRQVFKAKQ